MRQIRKRKLGVVLYEDLEKDSRHDVAESVSRKFGVSEPEAAEILKAHGELPLVAVSPNAIWPKLGHPLDASKVEEYVNALEDGYEFPPVVIDSSDRNTLVEGFHRTAATMETGDKEIAAIDIAGVTPRRIDG